MTQVELLIERAEFLNNANNKAEIAKQESSKLAEWQLYINTWVECHYGKLDKPVELRTCKVMKHLGMAWLERDEEPTRVIKVEYGFFMSGNAEDIRGTIIHELCHHVCEWEGKPDRDGDLYFENKLKEHGAPSTGVRVQAYLSNLNVCQCQKCNAIYARKRTFAGYLCECTGRIKQMKKEYTCYSVLKKEFPNYKVSEY